VIDEKRSEAEEPVAEATIQISVDGKAEHTAALGTAGKRHGQRLAEGAREILPEVAEVKLLDYKVRVIRQGGTGSSYAS